GRKPIRFSSMSPSTASSPPKKTGVCVMQTPSSAYHSSSSKSSSSSSNDSSSSSKLWTRITRVPSGPLCSVPLTVTCSSTSSANSQSAGKRISYSTSSSVTRPIVNRSP